ncbi:hypothetical protein [Candidatus Aalborgicola defluviihabitans]|uniref:hypothetical protein n=1 Tax=Candidatus Aalborgicola defluviihabitans TaxID=3386187 RepID=UPI00390B6905|nr:hypothetical protein [Burkholderiales bacterium]
MHPSLSHLESIDPSFLEPHVSLVVMREETELALHDAYLALDGLTWIFDAVNSSNVKLRNAGVGNQLLEIPAEGLAALIRIVCEQIKPATNNPTLNKVQRLRPDLFNHQGA